MFVHLVIKTTKPVCIEKDVNFFVNVHTFRKTLVRKKMHHSSINMPIRNLFPISSRISYQRSLDQTLKSNNTIQATMVFLCIFSSCETYV